MIRVLPLIMILPFFCFSQGLIEKLPDETPEITPYQSTYYKDNNDYKKIVSITTISKDKTNSFKSDTLQKVYFDTEGNQKKIIRYDNNIPSETTYISYYPNKKMKSWRVIGQKSITNNLYIYDDKNRISNAKDYYKTKSEQDSILTSERNYKYGTDGLIQIIYSTAGKKTEDYEYKENKLKYKKGFYISKMYEYNKDNQLVKTEEYMGAEIDSTKIMDINTYHYDKNLLISDSSLTSDNFKSKDYLITNYVYNRNLLKSVNVKYKELYRNIDFEYNSNNFIKQVTVDTNKINSAYLRHYMNYKIEDFYSLPIEYREMFDYDKNGNKISKRVYVNNELFSETIYVIEY